MNKKSKIIILFLFVILVFSGCESQNSLPMVSTDIGVAKVATSSEKSDMIEETALNLILPEELNPYMAIETVKHIDLLDELEEACGDYTNLNGLAGSEYSKVSENKTYTIKVREVKLNLPDDLISDIENGEFDNGIDLTNYVGNYSAHIILELLCDNTSLIDLSVDLEIDVTNQADMKYKVAEMDPILINIKKCRIAMIMGKENNTCCSEIVLAVNPTNTFNVYDLIKSIEAILHCDEMFNGYWQINKTFALIWGSRVPIEISLVAHEKDGQLISYSYTLADLNSSYEIEELSCFGCELFHLDD